MGLLEELPLTLPDADRLPLPVGVILPVAQGVGVSEALAQEDEEAEAVVHPDELKEGEPVVEPLMLTVPVAQRVAEGELDSVPVVQAEGE